MKTHDYTTIPWCDYTFNPWSGCAHVSPGCDHCYAERLPPGMRRYAEWGADKPRVMASESYWKQPLAWNSKAEQEGRRLRVFCGSTMDVLDARSMTGWPRGRLVKLIYQTPALDWLLLSKRAENWPKFVHAVTGGMREKWPPNAWAGVTVEDQQRADERIPLLLQVPARVRFVSCEPLIGFVNLAGGLFTQPPVGIHDESPEAGGLWRGPRSLGSSGLSWVIVGGESGPGARPMHPDWARSIRDQCGLAGVPFFFKQWGEWAPMSSGNATAPLVMDGGIRMWHVGTRSAGHLLDGVEYREFPR